MPQPISVRIAHHIPGRTRLAAVPPVTKADLASCAARLSASGHVRVEVRGNSLIITHHVRASEDIRSALGTALNEAGLILAPSAPRHPIGKATAAVTRIDHTLAAASGGRMDLTNAAFVGLLAAGCVQLARGNVVGPALTLFSQALTLALLHSRMQER